MTDLTDAVCLEKMQEVVDDIVKSNNDLGPIAFRFSEDRNRLQVMLVNFDCEIDNRGYEFPVEEGSMDFDIISHGIHCFIFTLLPGSDAIGLVMPQIENRSNKKGATLTFCTKENNYFSFSYLNRRADDQLVLSEWTTRELAAGQRTTFSHLYEKMNSFNSEG